MSTKREEERNEKVIRGLMKLPPNRRCINCDSLGPQYVCTNFWTFVCIACSGIHREFTHRVKSVSMSKFNTQEVQTLQNGGNQHARELFLKTWDMQRMRFPDSSNPDKIREFIKNVYIDKKYAGEISFDKPPRDTQGKKNHEEHRRASSYHSYSQSPPYDHQYEERRYGKQGIMLTRKPGSDRGYEGKVSSFLSSPAQAIEYMYDDQFANDSSASRISDYSHSSTGDPVRSGGQSPTGYNSPASQQVRDILIADACAQTLPTYSETDVKRERSASGSFCFSDGNLVSLKSANSSGLVDSFFKPEHDSLGQQHELPMIPSSKSSTPACVACNDDFAPQFVQQENAKDLAVDFFTECSQQSSSTLFSKQKPSEVPIPVDKGWATFDIPQQVTPPEPQKGLPSWMFACIGDFKSDIGAFISIQDTSLWFSAQNSANHESLPVMDHQWEAGIDQVQDLTDSSGLQICNDFNVSSERNSLASYTSLSSIDETLVNEASIFSDQYADLAVTKGTTTHDRKSTNPFDELFNSEPEGNNVFLDMNSLQAALPNPPLALPNQQFPNAFHDVLSQPWFQQNSNVDYMHSTTKDGLPYTGGSDSSSQLQNMPSQVPVASFDGNPFA